MTLPDDARRRLARPLRQHAAGIEVHFAGPSTVPIGAGPWARHSADLVEVTARYDHLASAVPARDGFAEVAAWAREVIAAASTVRDVLRALSPFAVFEPATANRVLTLTAESLSELATAIEEDRLPRAKAVEPFIDWPVSDASPSRGDLLAEAFRMTEPPIGGDGDFSASRVFASYKYRASALLDVVEPHLRSLRLPVVSDALAMVSTIGFIVRAEDPVTAYGALAAWSAIHPRPATEPVASAAYTHLRDIEPALRHSRSRVARAMAALNRDDDLEAKALTLADMYKRLLEGPVRQYLWVMHCLARRTWQNPPTLGAVQKAVISDGGWLAAFASIAVLRQFRNAEAHETLRWDGPAEAFVVDDGRFTLVEVLEAAVHANSFALGCEAALAMLTAIEVDDPTTLPSADQTNRAAAWRRAEAFFGTNGLRLVSANFNARTATVTVERLNLADVNPCFQALIVNHRVLPRVEHFEVYTPGGSEPLIQVSAAALAANYLVWKDVFPRLSAMPFSVFLPANLDARRHVESESAAARAVAWIAADDVLDAIDGTVRWDRAAQEVFAVRVSVVEEGLETCLPFITEASSKRIRLLLGAVTALRESLPLPPRQQPDTLEAVSRIRLFWDAWGPVPRHPSVRVDPTDYEDEHDVRPALNVPGIRYSTL